jgi:hypothetical protein
LAGCQVHGDGAVDTGVAILERGTEDRADGRRARLDGQQLDRDLARGHRTRRVSDHHVRAAAPAGVLAQCQGSVLDFRAIDLDSDEEQAAAGTAALGRVGKDAGGTVLRERGSGAE